MDFALPVIDVDDRFVEPGDVVLLDVVLLALEDIALAGRRLPPVVLGAVLRRSATVTGCRDRSMSPAEVLDRLRPVLRVDPDGLRTERATGLHVRPADADRFVP